MAQLPPKIPNMAHSWCSSPHQRLPFMTNTNSISTNLSTMTLNNANANANTNQTQSSWVDEFLDFSSVRRGTHRRSVSDSVAFLDPQATPFGEECRGNSTMHVPSADANCGGFDRFDDEQLMSMFSDDLSVPATSNPSTPSDQNSNNEEKTTASPSDHHHLPKNEPGEADSSGQNELQATHQQQHPAASNGDAIVDPKRVKRILANRQSAQRSRVRKLQYVSELERSVTSLQTEVSALSPRVAFFDHQRLILNVDNSALKQRIAALAQDKIFKDAHQEALKKEIERLRQLFHHQNTKNTNNNINAAPPPPPSQSQQPSMNKSANSQT